MISYNIGEFEQLIMMALLRLGSDAYGMRIRQEIQHRAGRTVSLGAVYTTLDRLESKGLVSSWTGGATTERGGRAKRFFKIEAAGALALQQSLNGVRRMMEGLDKALGAFQ